MSEPGPYAPLPEPVPKYNRDRAASSKWQDQPNQHWILQHSGRGYKIKNCEYQVYLSAPSNKAEGTLVGVSDAPVVWTLMRTHCGFIVLLGEEDRAIDLHYGLDRDGNMMTLWGVHGGHERRRWLFDRISDDVGGEVADSIVNEVHHLKQRLEEKEAQLARYAESLAAKDKLLAAQAEVLSRIGYPEHTVDIAAEVYFKLDEMENTKREVKALIDGLGIQGQRRPNNAA